MSWFSTSLFMMATGHQLLEQTPHPHTHILTHRPNPDHLIQYFCKLKSDFSAQLVSLCLSYQATEVQGLKSQSNADIFFCLFNTKLCFQPFKVDVWPGINGLTSLSQHGVLTIIHSALDAVDYLTVTSSLSTSFSQSAVLSIFFIPVLGQQPWSGGTRTQVYIP